MPPSLDSHSIPEHVADYEILSTLGAGGMGVVYAGRQPDIGKRVAVKVLRGEMSMDRDLVERFVGEARAVNEIRHRSIVDIFGFGRLDDGRYYLVMEQLEGRSFEQLLADERKVSIPKVLDWTAQILEALDAAHAAGVIHRDLKPSNLFLVELPRQTPYVKLLDFGIAKLIGNGRSQRTQGAMMIGSPDYMAPEQVIGGPVTFATDLYALGCVMFELISGKKPFQGKQISYVLGAKLNGATPSLAKVEPALPADLVRLVEWLMERDPKHRPQTAEEVLTHVLALRQQFPRRTPTPVPVMPRRRVEVETKLAAPEVDPAPTRIHVPAQRPIAVEVAEQIPTEPRLSAPAVDLGAETRLARSALRVVPQAEAAAAPTGRLPVPAPAPAPRRPLPTPLLVLLLLVTMMATSGVTAYTLLQHPGALEAAVSKLTK